MKNELVMQTKYHLDNILIILILIFALVVRLRYFIGVFRFDSFFYAQLSYFASQLDFHSFFYETSGFFAANRIVLVLPTGLLYRLFGVNDFSSVGFVLIASIVNIVLIYLLGSKLFNKQVGLVAAFFLAIYPLEVINSTQFMPDGLVPTFLSAAALAFLYGEEEKNSRKKLIFYYACGLFIGLAQYVRENAFVFIFVLIGYGAVKRMFKVEYVWILAGGATIFLLTSLFFLLGAGDFFYQINQLTTFFLAHKERIYE